MCRTQHAAHYLYFMISTMLNILRKNPLGFRKADVAKTPSRVLPAYIPILFVTCVVILLANAFSLSQRLQALKHTNNMMMQTSRVIDRLQYVNVLIMDAESSTRGYFLSDKKIYLGPLKTAQQGLGKEFAALEDLLDEYPQQFKNLTQLRTLFTQKMTLLEQAVAVFESGGLKDIVGLAKLGEGRDTMDEIRLLTVIMVQEAYESQLARDASYYNEYRNAVLVGMLINAVAILMLILLYRLNRRNFFNRLRVEDALQNLNESLETQVSARTAQLSILSRHLISVAEEEKARLARELHDEMGASLTAINMDMAGVTKKIREIDPQLAGRLQKARETLLDTIDMKRRIIENLRPSMLDNLGLSASVRSHCEDFTRLSGIRCDVDIPEEFDRIDPLRTIALYRITQESLTNIVKYAKATKVTVSLKIEGTDLRLQIIDDGVGIAFDALSKPMSHGLLGMRERTLLLGGTFIVQRGPNNRGTVVTARIPVAS